MTISKISRLEIKAELSGLRIDPPTIGYDWADKYFYLPPESSGFPGKWLSYPYQRAIINWVVSPSVLLLVLYKCRRIGFTKSFSAALCCLLVDRRLTIGVWHPSDGDSKKYVKDEINPLFENIPVLRDALKCDPFKKSPYKTDNRMEFRGAVAHFNGSISGANFRQSGVAVAIGDECDSTGFNIGNEGDFVELMRGRTEQSPFGKVVVGSTPKIKGASVVEREYNAATLRMKRALPCPHCGSMIFLEWEDFKYKKTEDGRAAADAYFVCHSCSGEIRYASYPSMDENGVWISDDGTVWYDEEEDLFISFATGLGIGTVDSLGAHIWSAYSYEMTWIRLATLWINAVNEDTTGDRSKLITFINQNLARTYSDSGATISSKTLVDRIEKYNYSSIPNMVEIITAGIDVQSGIKERVEIVILGVSGNCKDVWVIRKAVVYGDIGDRATQEGLDEVLLDMYKREDGKILHIKYALIDEGDGNKTEEVRSWVLSHAAMEKKSGVMRRFWRSTKGTVKGKAVQPGSWVGDGKKRVACHMLNVNVLKDRIYKHLLVARGKNGAFHFCEDIDDVFFDQLVGENRVVKRQGGRSVVSYVPKSNAQRVEALDCTVYGYAAALLATNNY